jgi:mannose-6-phosphate isomerase
VECMANSDNVIRAGLTPKLRDVPNLIANLTYNAGGCEAHTVEPVVYDSIATVVDGSDTYKHKYTVLYDPPIPEFSILKTELETHSRRRTYRAIDGPSVCIVTEGTGEVRWAKDGKGVSWLEDGQAVWDADSSGAQNKMSVRRGDVFFIGADWDVEICMTGFHPMVTFRAFTTANEDS